MPHSEASGWYSVEALNHILYEHVLEPVALVRVIDILPGELYTKHDILQHAPQGCQGIIIQYQHKTGPGNYVTHYKTRMKTGDQWYECESIAYSQTGNIMRLTDDAWPTDLTPPENSVTSVYSLAAANAYESGLCLIKPPSQIRTYVEDNVPQLSWIDGSTLTVSTTCIRHVHADHRQFLTQHNINVQETANAHRNTTPEHSTPDTHQPIQTKDPAHNMRSCSPPASTTKLQHSSKTNPSTYTRQMLTPTTQSKTNQTIVTERSARGTKPKAKVSKAKQKSKGVQSRNIADFMIPPSTLKGNKLRTAIPQPEKILGEKVDTPPAEATQPLGNAEHHEDISQLVQRGTSPSHFIVNTFNVRGWMTQSHQDFQEYISILAEDTKPQVIVLTETKLAKKQQRNFFKTKEKGRNLIYTPLTGYKAFHSVFPNSQNPQAGVSILLENTLVDMCTSIHNHTLLNLSTRLPAAPGT